MASLDSSRATPLITLIAIILSVAALYFARAVLVPLALAVLIAFILSPVVTWLEKLHVGRVLSVAIVSMLFIAGSAAMAWVVTHQLLDVTDKFPDYRQNIQNKLAVIRSMKDGRISRATGTVSELGSEISAAAASQPSGKPIAHANPRPLPVVVQAQSNPFSLLTSWLGPLLGPIGTGGVVVVFAIFMLMNRKSLRNRLLRLAGRGHLGSTTRALDEATRRVSRYLLLQSVVNVCYGCLVGFGLHLIGVPNPALWGVLAGLLRYVPYLGPLIGGALPLLLALGAFDDWKRPLFVLAMFVVLDVVTANFVEPMLYGSHTGITSLAILIAAIFWTVVWGPVGLLLSTPLTVCLVAFGKHAPQLQFLTILFGDETVLSPEAQIYQRLLASDPDEARQIAEAYVRENSVDALYESVLIPVLLLAKRDGDRRHLDPSEMNYLYQNLRDLVEDVGDRFLSEDPGSGNESERCAKRSKNEVVVISAQDEGDEIVGVMLAQLAAWNYRIRVLSAGRISDLEHEFRDGTPFAVCISAVPPCALSHIRSLFQDLKAKHPDISILIGLWRFAGVAQRAAERIGLSADDKIVTTLPEITQHIGILCEHAC